MLRRPVASRLLTAVACLSILAAAGNATAQDINNPILIYQETPSLDGSIDSVLSTRVTFDPLPEYGTQTSLTIEHYALFSTDSGMVVELRGEAVDRIMLRMPHYAKFFPGAIKKGDTLISEFQLTPEQVGVIPLSVIIYDNIELLPDKPIRVGVMNDISFILGADGKTFGVASAKVSPVNSTVLGPAPDLLSAERVFHVKPRYPEPSLKWLDLPQRPNFSPEENVFDLEVRVQPVADHPGRRRVDCRIIPYQDFEFGIAWQVTHSDELTVTELDTCVLGPVWADSIYGFSFVVNLVAPGLGHLNINVVTPNPDYGVKRALFSNRPGVIGADMTLTIGVDEKHQPVIITDTPIRLYLRAAQRASVEAKSIDPRFAFIEKYWKEEYETQTVEGPRFKFVMVHAKP